MTRMAYWTYDALGNKILEEAYELAGEILELRYRHRKQYNENGDLVYAADDHNGDEIDDQKTVYSYDAAYKLLTTKEYALGELVSTSIYTYDARGYKSSRNVEYLGSDKAETSHFEWDTRGRLLSETLHSTGTLNDIKKEELVSSTYSYDCWAE